MTAAAQREKLHSLQHTDMLTSIHSYDTAARGAHCSLQHSWESSWSAGKRENWGVRGRC